MSSPIDNQISIAWRKNVSGSLNFPFMRRLIRMVLGTDSVGFIGSHLSESSPFKGNKIICLALETPDWNPLIQPDQNIERKNDFFRELTNNNSI